MPSRKAGEVRRGRITLVDAAPDSTRLPLLPGVVLLTDDGRGIARDMAERLADFGQNVAVVTHGRDEGTSPGGLQADLTSPAAVDRLLKRVRAEHGAVSGLVHLLPLAEAPASEPPMVRIEREVKSLYLLARGLEDDLMLGAEAADAICIAATGFGGRLGFGEGSLPAQFFAGQGGVGGFIKSLAHEWPDVLVRTIDLDPEAGVSAVVETMIAEMSIPDGPVEVGHAGRRRVTWEPVFEDLLRGVETEPLLREGSTVLVTGGARGITGAIAVELAKRYRPNLILTGRSEKPDQEGPDLADAVSPAEIKSRLIARAKAAGQEPSLPAIEAQFRRVVIDREIRANLEAIEAAGATLEYRPLDARDRDGMTRLIAEVEQRHDGIDGVIHGAGVMEDKLLGDKTPDSFDRVFGTKAESTLILRDLLKPERLAFFVLFASTSGRFGNKGQTDYAAGNEILAKTALELDRIWPGRVLAVDWGPWSQIGMSADLEAYMVERGFTLISPDDGPAMLIDELLYGTKGVSEIVIAGAAEEAGRPLRTVRRPRSAVAMVERRLEGTA